MSRLLQWLRRRLCGSELDRKQERIDELEAEIEALSPDYPDVDTTTVPRETVEDALGELDGWDQRRVHFHDDGSYRVPTLDSFEAVTKANQIEDKKYVADFFDCDNYADRFASLFAHDLQINAVGVVVSFEGEAHAFNVVIVDNDGIEARLWEPQQDEWVTDSDDPMYILDGAMIRI